MARAARFWTSILREDLMFLHGLWRLACALIVVALVLGG